MVTIRSLTPSKYQGLVLLNPRLGISFSQGEDVVVAEAATILATTVYYSSNKAIISVLIDTNISVIISLNAADTTASIQLHIYVSLSPGPSSP